MCRRAPHADRDEFERLVSQPIVIRAQPTPAQDRPPCMRERQHVSRRNQPPARQKHGALCGALHFSAIAGMTAATVQILETPEPVHWSKRSGGWRCKLELKLEVQIFPSFAFVV